MTGYRVSPQGVDQTLARVRAEADGLGQALADVWTDVPGAGGGSQIVADALGGFVEAAQEDMRVVAERLESAPGAMVRAVAAILDGDEEMARTHAHGLSQAETFSSAPVGPPSGIQWPPGPVLPGSVLPGSGGSAYDASRFGARPSLLPSEPLGSGDSLPAFDLKRFSAAEPGIVPEADS
ncbi:DUF6507 family protein [Promicromonospora alba]|uniref:DUF6507 family protein n=1 Tax=Promicromonospora alba TaxID=1616110 RepID=A0ABV9HQX1_9MICO